MSPQRLLNLSLMIILVLLVPILYAGKGLAMLSDLNRREWGGADFTAYYTAADLIAEGQNPYDTPLFASRAGNRVFLGHWAETMNYAQKMGEAKTFFGQAPDEWRKELLRDYNISYLFYGPRERALPGFEPEGEPYLVESYSNSLVTIYRVVISKGG